MYGIYTNIWVFLLKVNVTINMAYIRILWDTDKDKDFCELQNRHRVNKHIFDVEIF